MARRLSTRKVKVKDNILIIGDIAGRFTELEMLMDMARKACGDFTVVSVGDMVDRGSESNKVLEFFSAEKDAKAILGNHEDLMRDFVNGHNEGFLPKYNEKYNWGVWKGNGGFSTVDSYGGVDLIPKKHIKFLNRLPLFIEHEDNFGKIIITHAPINPVYGFEKLKKVNTMEDYSLCWNRGAPTPIKGVNMQFHGHNAMKNVRFFTKNKEKFAVCVDTSHGRKLSGILWPSMDIFSVNYINKTPSVY